MLEKYLKKHRLNHNLTQSEMAKKLGTSQSYYSQLETGRKKPGFQMVNKIAKVLKVQASVIRELL